MRGVQRPLTAVITTLLLAICYGSQTALAGDVTCFPHPFPFQIRFSVSPQPQADASIGCAGSLPCVAPNPPSISLRAHGEPHELALTQATLDPATTSSYYSLFVWGQRYDAANSAWGMTPEMLKG